MREPKCALNLPNIIGQTPTVPSRECGSPQSRRPNSPLSRRYGRKPGIAGFIGRHIFNRSFRNDVNAAVANGLRSRSSRWRPGSGARSTNLILLSRHASRFFAPRWPPAAPTLCPSANARCGPAADRKVSKKGLRLQAECGKTTCRSTHECYGRLASFQELGMIGVLTHHWAKVDRIDEARKLLDRNGDAQSKAPGFVSRQTLIALADPAKITTLVVWTTNDIYEAWRASPQRTMAMSGADRLWAKPPESERFQVVG